LIKNKKILITGGSSGLGFELINELLNHNNKIYHLGRFIEKKKNLKSIICNLENIKNIKNKLKKLLNIKKIDYVFLNAGILGPIKKITSVKVKELEQVFKINFFSNKEILDYLIINKIKTKLIVAISSGAALRPKFGWYPYCSSKSAFKFLIESYSLEDPKRKFINIAPGLIKTKMQDAIYKVDEKKINSVKKFKDLNKRNKIPSPKEVAINILYKIKKIKLKNINYIDLRNL
jgi:NAD(P)-dependent dehydrogenase (short-subunit alcohol dehydrogenase family)